MKKIFIFWFVFMLMIVPGAFALDVDVDDNNRMDAAYGGTNRNTSGDTGFAYIAAGVWSVVTTVPETDQAETISAEWTFTGLVNFGEDTGAAQLNITPQSAIVGIYIDQDYDADVINVIQDGLGNGIKIVHNRGSGYGLDIYGRYPVHIVQDTDDGYGLHVSRDLGGTDDVYPLIRFINDNAANIQSTLFVDHDGTGGATGYGFHIDSENAAAPAVYIESANAIALSVAGVIQAEGHIGIDQDDAYLWVGEGYNISMKWDTNSTNDDIPVMYFIESDGADIPILNISDASYAPNGDSTNDDLTEPGIRIWNDAADGWSLWTHSGTTATLTDGGTTTATSIPNLQVSFPFNLPEDAGAMTVFNMGVSDSPSDGDEMSYSFMIDSDVMMKLYAEADGAGGADTFEVQFSALIKSDVAAGNPVFELIATTDTPTNSPETNAETGWIEIDVGGTPYYIPYYI